MVSSKELEVLVRLRNAGEPMEYTQFRYTTIPKQNSTPFVLSLINLGFVERVNPVSDEREGLYQLTPEGNKYLDNVLEYASQQLISVDV